METTTIHTKLLKFQSSIEAIKKDGKNSFFKKPNGKESTYATLPNILSEVKPILSELKLVITQPIINGEVLTIITDAETGEKAESGILIPNGLNAQQIGSAITYFRRYTLSSLLSLEIDEDDDGNKASQPKKEGKPSLTEKALHDAVTRLEAGETSLFNKINDAFALTETQQISLTAALNMALDIVK